MFVPINKATLKKGKYVTNFNVIAHKIFTL